MPSDIRYVQCRLSPEEKEQFDECLKAQHRTEQAALKEFILGYIRFSNRKPGDVDLTALTAAERTLAEEMIALRRASPEAVDGFATLFLNLRAPAAKSRAVTRPDKKP